MPRSIPVPLRKAIQRRHQGGQTARVIAAELDLCVRTVRALLQRWRQADADDLQPAYDRCGPRMPATAPEVVQAARHLRQEHPTWGAPLIRVFLRREFPTQLLPSARTIQRWLPQHDLPPAPAGRPTRRLPPRACQPHEVWQMDAAEQVPLQSGQRVSWLRLLDEATGAALQTLVFPPGGLVAGGGCGRTNGLAAGVCTLGTAAALAGR
jgi:transposase